MVVDTNNNEGFGKFGSDVAGGEVCFPSKFGRIWRLTTKLAGARLKGKQLRYYN